MLSTVGIARIGVTNVPRPDIVLVVFRPGSVSAKDVSKTKTGSKWVKLEGFSAVDISKPVSGSKYILIEQ